jgi:beta-lactamase superfamily II metal-dependent hydrolase
MPTTSYLDSDVVSVFDSPGPKNRTRLGTMLWGDQVRVLRRTRDHVVIEFTRRVWDDAARKYNWKRLDGYISSKVRLRDRAILKVRFIDVGQGDAAIVETPTGQLVLVDGGEARHLSNYVSGAWAYALRTHPLSIAAIVVTHGDADHYAGLPILVQARRSTKSPAITVDRVFHNGLVKAPGADNVRTAFGRSTKVDQTTYLTDLEDDLLAVPDKRMNKPFLEWKAALSELRRRNRRLKIKRVGYGDDTAFDFLAPDGLKVEVLGPIVEQARGRPALRCLRTPGTSSLSASHTINGHSVVLRVTCGNVRFLFGADLNEESEAGLFARARQDGRSLAAEILKVPHHGSADFAPKMFEAVRPVVSVVSSGDENAQKEYIHPRAGLVGALGRYSRLTVDKPLIFVTEMVAFFRRLGRISAHEFTAAGKESAKGTNIQNAYEKTVFGIVHVRTDGERVLVATHSGRADKKEAYVFRVDAQGDIVFEDPTVI